MADRINVAPTFLDRAIGWLDPDRGLRRARSRALLARAYEGASAMDGWRPKRAGASANTDHAADARSLRIRSRSLEQNVPYIARGFAAHTANIIGTGIMPRWTGPEADTFNSLWSEHAQFADADGRLDVYGIMALAYHTSQRDGEVLVRLRSRRVEDGFPIPLQYQVLEIDWLDDSRLGRVDGYDVVNGIAYDALGRVMGYYLFDQHPGELISMKGRRSTSSFVPADRIIHYFNPSRPGQGRGFPRLAPSIAKTRDLALYEDAELHRKNLETRLSVIASGDVEGLGDSSTVQNPTDPKDMGALPSGQMIQAPAGSNITVVEPKAAPGYVEYVKMNLHLIVAGAGWTYEMCTGDVRETNFSSARIRLLDYRREAEHEQWLHVIPGLIAPMVRAAADACALANKVRRASYQVEYATPKWDYVNPKDDVQADREEIEGGLSSISEKLRRRGYKPDDVFKEMDDDFKKLKASGVLDILMMFKKGRALAGDGAAGAGA